MRSYTRHQLKQDQFSAAAKETYSWVAAHRSKLVSAGIAVAVVLAIAIGGWFYIQQQDEAAGIALGHALSIYQAPVTGVPSPQGQTTSFATSAERAKAARAEFAKLADSYSHTRSGQIARYFEGLADQDAGNPAAAEKELQQVASSGRSDLAALAKFALASLYRSTGRDAQAVPLYKELIDHPANTVAKASAQLALASMYEPKQPQDARRIYEEVRKEDPRGPAGETAASRLAQLK